jgi:hypothetical protein
MQRRNPKDGITRRGSERVDRRVCLWASQAEDHTRKIRLYRHGLYTRNTLRAPNHAMAMSKISSFQRKRNSPLCWFRGQAYTFTAFKLESEVASSAGRYQRIVESGGAGMHAYAVVYGTPDDTWDCKLVDTQGMPRSPVAPLPNLDWSSGCPLASTRASDHARMPPL